jgi:hypothetical protein
MIFLCFDLDQRAIHARVLLTLSLESVAVEFGMRLLPSDITCVCVCDEACRRDCKRQLQRVPGGELWDWIR